MHQRIGKLNLIYLQEWVIVKNFDEFVKVVSENIYTITHVSFDHDLAEEHYISDTWQDSKYGVYTEKTGYDCAKWMKEYYKNDGTDLPILFVHSMNPVGTENIVKLFTN